MAKRSNSQKWPEENLTGFHKVLSQLDSLEFYSVLTTESKQKTPNHGRKSSDKNNNTIVQLRNNNNSNQNSPRNSQYLEKHRISQHSSIKNNDHHVIDRNLQEVLPCVQKF